MAVCVCGNTSVRRPSYPFAVYIGIGIAMIASWQWEVERPKEEFRPRDNEATADLEHFLGRLLPCVFLCDTGSSPQ